MQSSPRVEECRRNAAYCEAAAAVATDPLAKATFEKAADAWRALANQHEELSSLQSLSWLGSPTERDDDKRT
jgi:hypothetical protein